MFAVRTMNERRLALRMALKVILLIVLAALVRTVDARPDAAVKYRSVRAEHAGDGKEGLILPYAFSTESMGTTLGVGGGVKGYGQDQLWTGATVFKSADGANAVMAGLWDFRMPGLERLYVSAIGSIGYYPRQRAYAEPPGGYKGVKAGSIVTH